MTLKNFIFPLVLFLLGMGTEITGTLFKIQHWPYGGEIMVFGAILKLTGVVWAVLKLLRFYRKK